MTLTYFLSASYLPESTSSAAFLFLGSPRALLGLWLAVINLVTFLVFGLDKWKAKRKVKHAAVRRVPERWLFLLALLGGSVGALLGMKVFRHKTLHRSFRVGIPAILVLQVLLGIGWWYYLHFLR